MRPAGTVFAMAELFFENNLWRLYWINRKTQIRTESKKGKGIGTARIVGKQYDYNNQDMYQRPPRISYSGVRIPIYLRAKITAAFSSRGQRWR